VKVAYVTRLPGVQGELNGNRILLGQLRRFVDMTLVEVPGVAGLPYEASDLSGVLLLSKVHWRDFDLILTAEWGFAAVLHTLGVPFVHMVHMLPRCPDGQAAKLAPFKGFVQRAICGTHEVARDLRSMGIEPTVVPYPVDPAFNDAPVKKAYDIVWVGRDDCIKNVDGLVKVCEALPPGMRVTAFSSTSFSGNTFPENLRVKVAAPRSHAIAAIRHARVVLSTSVYETSPVVVTEAGCAGALVVVPKKTFGFGDHYGKPGVVAYDPADYASAAKVVTARVGEHEGRVTREYWLNKYVRTPAMEWASALRELRYVRG